LQEEHWLKSSEAKHRQGEMARRTYRFIIVMILGA